MKKRIETKECTCHCHKQCPGFTDADRVLCMCMVQSCSHCSPHQEESWKKEFDKLFWVTLTDADEFGCEEWIGNAPQPEAIKSFIRTLLASTKKQAYQAGVKSIKGTFEQVRKDTEKRVAKELFDDLLSIVTKSSLMTGHDLLKLWRKKYLTKQEGNKHE